MKIKCTHPDHKDGESCLDRAVGCSTDCECCMGIKPIKRSELSNIKMVAGGEKRINKVILNGNVHNWVGIGWIDEGKANKEDYLKYPEVID